MLHLELFVVVSVTIGVFRVFFTYALKNFVRARVVLFSKRKYIRIILNDIKVYLKKKKCEFTLLPLILSYILRGTENATLFSKSSIYTRPYKFKYVGKRQK